jgi:hypothetical protein
MMSPTKLMMITMIIMVASYQIRAPITTTTVVAIGMGLNAANNVAISPVAEQLGPSRAVG